MRFIRSFFNNTRKPVGFMGKMMVCSMNMGHSAVSEWGRSQLPQMYPRVIADLGCGGGKNAAELMKKFPAAEVTALDYSTVSVEKARKLNKKAVSIGKLRVIQGNVAVLPLKTEHFDLVTAMETVYFWPGPVKSFREVFRILKADGQFLIVNESDGTNSKDEKWTEMIDGMHLYSEEQICEFLREAGFFEVQVFHKPEKAWIAFLAKK